MNGIGGISQKGFTFSKEKAAIGKTSFANSAFNIQTENIGAVQSDVNGLLLSNPTLAILGTQQLSPPIVLQGNGWGTTSSTSQDVRFKMEVLPLQGTTAVGVFKLTYSLNNGSYTNGFDLNSNSGFTFYNSINCYGQITVGTVLTTNQGLSGSNYYFGSTNSYASVGIANYLLASSSNVTNRVLLCGSNVTGSLTANSSHGSLIIGANTATEAASGNHAIIANLAVRPIVVTNGTGTTTDVASLYVDGPSTHSGSVTGGLYSILVASGTSKLNGDLYCNGIFTNTGATSSNAYCALRAGTTTIAPLKITSGTNMTSPAGGSIEYNGSHYETGINSIRYGKGGVVANTYTTVGNSTTAETSLWSYISPANFFTTLGDKCDVTMGGYFREHASNIRQLKVYFGGTAGTLIFDSGEMTIESQADWKIEINLQMSASGKVKYTVILNYDRSVSFVRSGELTATLTTTNKIELTGTGVLTDDVKLYMGQALYSPVSNS